MYEKKLLEIIKDIKDNTISEEDALKKLKDLPFKDLEYANIDFHREIRTGYPEIIYCEKKEISHIVGIVKEMLKKDVNILLTRVNDEIYYALKDLTDDIEYHKLARVITIKKHCMELSKNKVLIVSAGTSDINVCEEAKITAEMLGTRVETMYDVGVAGIHRLLSRMDMLHSASVIIVVAGMEGALPSVIGGLVDVPIIAVPTSVGYGAHFNGLASLLAMLNSCASGVSVVNIDNGFGAGYNASSIIRQIERRK